MMQATATLYLYAPSPYYLRTCHSVSFYVRLEPHLRTDLGRSYCCGYGRIPKVDVPRRECKGPSQAGRLQPYAWARRHVESQTYAYRMQVQASTAEMG
jgi:hypothetical protein